MNTVTVTDELGERALRLTLPAPVWCGHDEIDTGIFREAVYVGARSKRCVVEYESIWQARGGGCVGTYYKLIEGQDELNRLAGEYPKVAEALEQAGVLTVEEL
jgi:hypothetical protein